MPPAPPYLLFLPRLITFLPITFLFSYSSLWLLLPLLLVMDLLEMATPASWILRMPFVFLLGLREELLLLFSCLANSCSAFAGRAAAADDGRNVGFRLWAPDYGINSRDVALSVIVLLFELHVAERGRCV